MGEWGDDEVWAGPRLRFAASAPFNSPLTPNQMVVQAANLPDAWIPNISVENHAQPPLGSPYALGNVKQGLVGSPDKFKRFLEEVRSHAPILKYCSSLRQDSANDHGPLSLTPPR